MATGYTYNIKDGISFEKFVMQCARAFGACIDMRDEPLGKEIPDKFPTSSYHLNALNEAKLELDRFEETQTEEWEKKAIEYNEARLQEYNERVAENKRVKESYEFMLEKVRAWNPPTTEHQGLKDFMIQQITASIKWYIYEPEKEEEVTGQRLKEIKYDCITHDIKYHTREHEKEVERTSGRNEWIEQLRESLK